MTAQEAFDIADEVAIEKANEDIKIIMDKILQIAKKGEFGFEYELTTKNTQFVIDYLQAKGYIVTTRRTYYQILINWPKSVKHEPEPIIKDKEVNCIDKFFRISK